MNSFYKDFDFTKAKKSDMKVLKKQELANLYARPPKETKQDMGNLNFVFKANVEHQADLLFLPDDNGYKYALVVVDLATHLCDAEPLNSKTSKGVSEALETIYNRNILELPETLTVDAGTEFKGKVLEFLEDNNVAYRFAKPKRHRQISQAERTNQYLAKGLFMRMTAQELLTGQPSREWVSDLPKFVKYINKKRKRKPPKEPKTEDSKCQRTGDDCDLLEIGTRVRAKLDHPLDVATDKNLHGRFRITDVRWDPVVREITNILLQPGQPPLYQLDDSKRHNGVDITAAYTKKQLQVVPDDEEAPPPSVIRGKPETYVAEKILDKKKEKNRIYYLVKWKGYPKSQATWEPNARLKDEAPKLITQFEKQE
jgi:hypothetical protein